DLWERWLPAAYRSRAPRVERQRGHVRYARRRQVFKQADDGQWADIWVFDGVGMPITEGFASAGTDKSHTNNHALTYDEMRPGAYDQAARLADMDLNHTEASLNFPTFPRFCGQTFLECDD